MIKIPIVAYGRSAVGKGRKGSLAKAHPVDYGAEVLKGVLDRLPELDPQLIDDVIVGSSASDGVHGMNLGRNLVLRAGLPHEIPGQTVNRFCSSGLQTIADAAANIHAGYGDVIVAGGVESMTNFSISMDEKYHNQWLRDHSDAYIPMGVTAENVADKYDISRKEMEEYAVESHQRAAKAIEAGAFVKEIIPVTGYDSEGQSFEFKEDETVRPNTSLEGLAALKPAFKEDGKVAAGTSSGINDGAGFTVLMSQARCQDLGIEPIAYFRAFAVAGVDPAYMGIGPIAAVPKVFEQSGLSLADMDVIEFNEAFASQVIATARELDFDMDKVNPRGGAIALGHPLGATGAIMTCKAISYLKDTGGKYGLITMCIGGGMGAAGIIEMA
ncbi:thiolase family protein [Aerococcus urinae]|uniref:thiolase family protein n=1 Tax=Aerococcus urinae TaxID=1376 RepID=UPI00254E80FC|nr:thiolase family protein [Aerococcus urinae]MDK6375240.1 thiolase family protein [Aerococcus urinae]MDK6420088.1 thiolase family protein [Aerococcus urinae]MDK8075581.1 thiolase family protein [Aerococcus urinae]MDK8084650.1 thiolase family protein [Aerococcus urinae]